MSDQADRRAASLELLREGLAPGRGEVLHEISAGLDSLTDFLKEQYYREFIALGGSKIKFVTGRPGSGKTHFLQCMLDEAEKENFLTVSFSAKNVWLHDFRDVYLEIFRQCGIERILKACSRKIIAEIGYDPDSAADGRSFLDFLSERGEADPLIKGEIRAKLREFFTKNPLLENSFGGSCSLLTGGFLGHPVLETANRDLLLAFLNGDHSVKLSQLRALGLSPSRITKFNARNLLRSLSEIVRLAGYAGIIIVIDDMEMLLSRSAENIIRYTKLRRDDTYESIRQLIDDIDNMKNIMFFMSFDRELIDNDNFGMKSYQALWMRIQNEVVSSRFNRFADMIDLDRYGEEFYSEDVLCLMAEKLSNTLGPGTQVNINIPEIRERALYGGLGIPWLINRAVCGKTEEESGKNV